MVRPAFFAPDVDEFRQEALVEERDGVYTLILNGENDNVRNSPFKRPFDAMHVNGIDDGDPHWLYPAA